MNKRKEKKGKKGKVIYKEPPVFSIISYLEKRGYGIASCVGRGDFKIDQHFDGIGVLKPRPAKKGILGRIRQAAIHLGTLWLNIGEAKTDKKWIFEVFGRENIKEVEKIAEGLVKEHDIDIKIVLDSEEIRYSELFF